MIVVGGALFMFGWTYADAARREATVVGRISGRDCGRTCNYDYVFRFNSVNIQDRTNTCKTALTNEGCKVGAPVLVYYDPEDASVSALQEFGAAARGRMFMGAWMVVCGLVLLGVYFILNRAGGGSGEAQDPDDGTKSVGSGVLHVAPGE